MFDLSLAEMAVIALVALFVIGPKELPAVVRQCARMMRQLRAAGSQIRRQFEMLDPSGEMEALRRELQENATYIQDEEGKLYRSYDISDLMAERKSLVQEALAEKAPEREGERENDAGR